MPIVPRIPQEPTATPQFTAPRTVPQGDATGQQTEQFGQAVGRAGAVAGTLVEQMRDEFDAAKVAEADNLLSDTIRKALHDPESGYLNTVGREAVDGRREKTFESVQTQYRRLLSPLTERQQRHFAPIAADRLRQAGVAADQHQARETRSYAIGTQNARVESFTVDAVNSVGTARYAADKAKMLAAVVEESRLRGEGEDELTIRALGATTKLHGQAVESLVAQGRSADAAHYLSATEAEIAPAKRGDLQILVHRAGVSDTSTRLAAQVQASAIKANQPARGALNQDEPPVPVDNATILADSQKTLDQLFASGEITAEVRDATGDRIRADDAQRRQTDAAEKNQVSVAAEQWLASNPMEPMTAMPPRLYQESQRLGLLGDLAGFAQHGRYTTDPKALVEVENLSAAAMQHMSPAEFAQRYRARLGNEDFNYAKALHAKATGTAGSKDFEVISKPQRIEEFFRRVGVLSRDKDETTQRQSAEYFLLREKVQDRIKQFEQTLGGKREMTGEELQKILNETELDKVWLDRSWLRGDVQKSSLMLTDEQRRNAYTMVGNQRVELTDVPVAPQLLDDVRRTIVRELDRRNQDLQRRGLAGQPVTEQAVIEYWLRAGSPKTLQDVDAASRRGFGK